MQNLITLKLCLILNGYSYKSNEVKSTENKQENDFIKSVTFLGFYLHVK